jgi:ABC transport system ATP-binding/permease protein
VTLISARGVSKIYGRRTVLEDVSITIDERDRVGLIGINGAGKSTLIRILLGQEDADGGEIQRKRGLTVRCVEQSPKLDPEQTVLEAVKSGLEKNAEVKRRLEQLMRKIDETEDEAQLAVLIEAQSLASDELDRAGGWNVEHRAEAAMSALSVPEGSRKIGTLSQGEMRRVALCAGLLSAPELLVLDEPTNHIDVRAIEWLEQTLVDYRGALLLVTHDRYFLDRVATRHAELDRGSLSLYEGNYSEYLVARAERDALEAKVEHKRRRAIENELQWVRRRAPARTTKQKARLERFDALVAARPKMNAGDVELRLPHPPRIGKTILELSGVSKSFGGPKLIDRLDLLLAKGDRLAIIGPNGAGKTTLLRMIIGELTPDEGTITHGLNTMVAYADQRRILDESNTVLEEVSGDSDFIHVGETAVPVHGFLSGLLFDGDAQRTKIAALSGGEKSRVALAKALRVTANLLILDEPTNDLDLGTLRVLEDALLAYPGCVLVVSHDRYFLDRVSTGALVFEGEGKVVRHEGGAMRHFDRLEEEKAPAPKEVKPARVKAEGPRKLSFKEKRELEGMEAAILEAEAKVSALEAELSDPEAAKRLAQKMGAKIAELDAAKAEVDRLYARWAELEAQGKQSGE